MLCDSGSVIPQLAPELLDMIIGHVRGKKALAACSLVSRTWNMLSKPHQFYITRIRYEPRRRTWDHYLQFLMQHPRIAAYIRNLWLTDGRDTPGQGPLLATSTICQLLSHLPHLLCLHLRDVRLYCSGRISEEWTRVVLKSLVISNVGCVGEPVQEIAVEVLRMFTKVDTINLSYLYNIGRSSDHNQSQSTEVFRKLPDDLVVKSLRLWDAGPPMTWYSILSTAAVTRTLKDLQLHVENLDDCHGLSRLFQEVGSHLESLDLRIQHYVGASNPVDLREYTDAEIS